LYHDHSVFVVQFLEREDNGICRSVVSGKEVCLNLMCKSNLPYSTFGLLKSAHINLESRTEDIGWENCELYGIYAYSLGYG